jgi:4-diphosphocytidyl-2-C-methyl-D-erythritol kinase
MVVYPNAKINLGLKVLDQRPDGFHNIDTVLYPIHLHDILEVSQFLPLDVSAIPRYQRDQNKFLLDELSAAPINSMVFIQDSAPSHLKPDDNICVKAYHIFKKHFNQTPSNVFINVIKKIPDGAGLGGASSDAVFVLKALNELLAAPASEAVLLNMAAELGSDCPFFIKNVPSVAQQKGGLISDTNISLEGYRLLLVIPDVKINTKWAYSTVTPALPGRLPSEIVNSPITNWQNMLVNDFEIPVFKKYPEIADIKNDLIDYGATYASMSGSGSVVYGIFNVDEDLSVIENKYNTFNILLT